jgi:hypothetical protein
MVLIGLSHCLYGSAIEHPGVAILQDDLANLHKVPMFHWDDIRYFLAFVRTGSMAAAATKLGVNQSTVQRRLRAWGTPGTGTMARHRGAYTLTGAAGAEDFLVAAPHRAHQSTCNPSCSSTRWRNSTKRALPRCRG